MESSLSTSRLISALSRSLLSSPLHNSSPNRFVLSSKRLASQDFREYAKPVRLLPVTRPETCRIDTFVKEEETASIRSGCLYRVRLSTSSLYGSDLSDLNAGILLCVMDGNGDAILQRFPAVCSDDIFQFGRGCVADFVFDGPKLGNVEAVWLSIESGQWRVSGLNLTTIVSSSQCYYTCLEYGFDLEEDVLIGEGRHSCPMVELRPSSVSERSSNDFTSLKMNVEFESGSLGLGISSNEEGMKEYTDLKSTLLLYDGLAVLVGWTILFISGREDAGLAFLTGGIGGFLYLICLQRSVDGLGQNGDDGQTFGLVLPVAVALVVARYGSSSNSTIMLTAKEVVFGMAGFLACKVAVLMAAFTPLPDQNKRGKIGE